jgi:hypothetical protein
MGILKSHLFNPGKFDDDFLILWQKQAWSNQDFEIVITDYQKALNRKGAKMTFVFIIFFILSIIALCSGEKEVAFFLGLISYWGYDKSDHFLLLSAIADNTHMVARLINSSKNS